MDSKRIDPLSILLRSHPLPILSSAFSSGIVGGRIHREQPSFCLFGKRRNLKALEIKRGAGGSS